MAERLEPAAQLLVDLAGVTAGDRVLDVACGTGNAALAAAERGARAVGVDFEPALLAIARERAAGRDVEFREGDAEALPVGDGEFSVVLSAFGVMYTPDHAAAAAELARACAPGARLALAAWVPGSFMPAMGVALAPYLPPPPEGSGPPSRWGDQEALDTLLSSAGLSLEETAREQLPLEFAHRDEAVGFLVSTAGHVLAEQPRLEAEARWYSLLTDLRALVDSNTHHATTLVLDYLVATARR